MQLSCASLVAAICILIHSTPSSAADAINAFKRLEKHASLIEKRNAGEAFQHPKLADRDCPSAFLNNKTQSTFYST